MCLCRRFAYLALATLALATGCRESSSPPSAPPPPPPKRLTILTPHNENIRDAVAVVFSRWYAQNRGTSVHVNWIPRGTPECVALIEETARAGATAEARQKADLLFGGGLTDHQFLASQGFSRPLKLDELTRAIPPEVAGLPTRDPNGRWFANALSSFGIVFNEPACAQRGIAPPATWDDLADPRFFGWLGIADPAASGSHLQCMVVVLQKYGWKEGWGRLMRMFGNSRALVERSASALRQIQNGVFLAGFAVNFDGLTAQRESGGIVKYVNPPGATTLTPSIVSALQMSDEPALAEDFVRFLLSDDGQMLWGIRPAEGQGTPLYHYPVNPLIYTKLGVDCALPENPFKTDFGLKYDLQKAVQQTRILPPLVHAACGDNHVALQKAWKAVIDAGLPPAAVTELIAPPFDEQTAFELGQEYAAAAPAEAKKMLAEWSATFAAKYRKALELATKRP